MANDVKGMEEITSGLTRTILADDAVPTSSAVPTSTRTDEMDAIANRLGQTILGEDANQRLATLPAGAEKAVEEEDPGAELDPARAAKKQDKGKGRQTKEEEEAIDALGAACSNWSIEDDEAKARREAEQLQEQLKKEQEEKKRAFEIAEAKRESEEYDALLRQFQEHGAKAHEIKRKQRKEEAARQQLLAAEAEATALAEGRAQEERRMQEEALAAQAQRESDDRARLQLSQEYERIFAENAAIAIAQANAQEAQRQQQRHEAELIAQYNEVVARQSQIAELQRQQQEEAFLQQLLAEQHQAYPHGEQVAECTEDMDTALECFAFEGTEMDTSPEMEASGGNEMDWEQVEERTPLLAEPLVPSSQLIPPQTPLAAEPSAPSRDLTPPGTWDLGDDAESQVVRPDASSSPSAEGRPIEADETPATAAIAEAEAGAEATAATAAEPAKAAPESVLQLPSRAATPPSPPSRAITPPPPPTPVPAPVAPSPETIKAFFKRAAPNHTLAALRPQISALSPLGRLLSQQRSIPQVVLPQVLGKRAREDWEDGGRDIKRAKLEGELRLEVGGKRKREAEEFPGNKRVMLGRVLGRALAVPGSRFAVSPSVPILAPTSNPPTASPTTPAPTLSPSPPPPPTPSPPPPPPAGQPRRANPHRGLAEAIELFNDLPSLRAEIEWMRAQRRLNTSRKETRGMKTPSDKTIKGTSTPASYWENYRENPSR